MENPAQSYDAVTWLGRLSVHQDFFWFCALLVWGLAMILWWRHPQRRTAWAWLPGAGLAAGGTALLQFGMFNPTFDFFQDRLIPGTVANYRPAVVDPYWLADVLMGAALAAMPAMWGWLAARRAGRPHLRWMPIIIMAAGTGLHVADPALGAPLIALMTGLAAIALWPHIRMFSPAKHALVGIALLPLASTVGPVAVALHVLQRNGPPTPMGLGTAAFLSLLGLVILRCLARGLPARLPAETLPAFRRDVGVYVAGVIVFLATGLLWGIQTGRDNRLEIQQNRLRTTAAHAKVFDPALLAPFQAPEFRIELKSPAGEPAPATSSLLKTGVGEPARRRLAEVVIATPFLDHARLLVIRDGWLVAALSSDHDSRTGEVEVLRRATAADLAQWERKEPYVEESPVPEIGYAYYCRAPIVAPDGTMLGWLDCVRREYYLSVERRWRAAPFLMTALGILLLTLVFVQRQIGREREIALRTAAVAAEGNRIKTAFLANVSHELRTPLQSILGYSELLRQELGREHHGRLDALRQQGELMTRLVNDLIDLSAVESGSFQLAPRAASPAGLVREIVESLHPRARAKGLALRCDIAANVPAWVQIDDGRLRQVLINLIGNALKFTAHGSVGVSVGAVATPAGAWSLAFAVTDTGPGIPQDQQSKLFTPFTRLAQTASEEGSGLGLALSAALCRAMGGTITLESDGRNGCCFTATVSAIAVDAPVAAAKPAPGVRRASPHRILVVDDNRLVRELFLSSLAEHGAHGRSARTCAEALAQVRDEIPDVVVLDLSLPDGDGADLVPQLRALAPKLRIVGASAHAGVADRQRALAAGMDAFIVKPVTLDVLWAAVTGDPSPPNSNPVRPEASRRPARELLAAFANELPAKKAALAQAVQSADWPQVRALAHYLRNSALVIQADALYAACTGLEEAAAADDAAAVTRCWQRCAPLLEVPPA